MKISALASRTIFALTILSLVLFAVSFWIYVIKGRELAELDNSEQSSYLLIASMLQASKDSNRLALGFMATGSADYIRDRDELLGVFKGFYPVPEESSAGYWHRNFSLLPSQDYSGSPLSVLANLHQLLAFDWVGLTLEKLSSSMDGLQAAEKQALDMAIAGGVFPAVGAQSVLYGADYRAARLEFRTQLQTFHKQIQSEMNAKSEVLQATQRLALNVCFASLFLALILVGLMYWVMSRTVGHASATRNGFLTQPVATTKSNPLQPHSVADHAYGLKEEPVSLQGIINTLRIRHESLAMTKGLGFAARLFSSNPAFEVLSDEDCVTDILSNLLDNAVRFTSQGEITVEIALTQSAINRGVLYLTVEDTGAGLSNALVHRINEPFNLNDGSHSTSKGEDSFGLGLFTSKYLTDAMNGQIEVRSKAGSGSLFRVALPVGLKQITAEGGLAISSVADGTPAAPAMLSPCQRDDSLKGRHIMVIDDHQINLKICSRVLERRGATVACFSTATQAIEHLFSEPPDRFDAVLMDLQMPQVDGYEALSHVRKHILFDQLPVFAFTAGQDHVSRSELIEKGFAEVFYKPLDVELVCMTLHQLKKGESLQFALPVTS